MLAREEAVLSQDEGDALVQFPDAATRETLRRGWRRHAEANALWIRPCATGAIIACGVIDVIIGAIAIYFGVSRQGKQVRDNRNKHVILHTSTSSLQCDIPLATWAVAYGSVIVLSGCFAVCSGVTFLFSRITGYVLYVASVILGVVGFGLLIWGSVMSFSSNRWNRVVVSRATPAPCDVELYEPVAAVVIVGWVLVAVSTQVRLMTATYLTCVVPCGQPLWPVLWSRHSSAQRGCLSTGSKGGAPYEKD